MNPAWLLGGSEPEGEPGSSPGDVGATHPITLYPLLGLAASASPRTHLRRRIHDELSSGEMVKCVERLHVRDAGKDDGRGKEGEKAFSTFAPASSSLREILEAREREYSLTTTLGHDGGETRKWSHVGQLVEG